MMANYINLNENEDEFKIYNYNNVKAYPSVNSTSGGQIHSEENVRWLIKQITDGKSFIINDNNSFKITGGAGNALNFSGGMINIDGYLFSISKPENISFDNNKANSDDYAPYLPTQSIGRTMLKYIGKVSNDFNTIITLDNLKPSNSYNIDNAITNWNNLNPLKNNIVGKVTVTYTDKVFEYFEWNKSNNFTYNYHSFLVNELKANSSNTQTINGNTYDTVMDLGQPYVDTTNKQITYPVIYSRVGNDENNLNLLHYTDGFGMECLYTYDVSYTNVYPYSGYNFTNMFNDDFNICTLDKCNKRNVAPKIIDYSKFYTNNGMRDNNTLTNTNYINDDYVGLTFTDANDSGDKSFKRVFNITSSDDINTIFNSAIRSISGYENFEYNYLGVDIYGIKSIDNDNNRRTELGNYKPPIAFMSANGELIPRNIVTKVNDTYVVLIEGYADYLRRKLFNVTEPQAIRDITDTQLTNHSGFTDAYNNYVAPYINMYIQTAQSSINLFALGLGTNGSSYRNKYKNNKAGNILNDNHQSGYTITINNYYTKYQTIKNVNNKDCLIMYEAAMNESNDWEKIRDNGLKHIIRGTYLDNIANGNYINNNRNTIRLFNNGDYAIPTDINDATELLHCIDDYINYIKRCKYYDNTSNLKLSKYKITTLDWDNTNNTFSLFNQAIDPKTTNAENGYIQNICLYNGTLVPYALDNMAFAYGYTGNNENSGIDNTKGFIQYDFRLNAKYMLSTTGTQADNFIDSIQTYGVCGFSYMYDTAKWCGCAAVLLKIYKDGQNYLLGKETFENSNIYRGLKPYMKLPADVTENDTWIENILFSSERYNTDFDLESNANNNTTYQNLLSKKLYHRRRAMIHFNKLYGDDYITLEEYIKQFSVDLTQAEFDALKPEDMKEGVTYYIYE